MIFSFARLPASIRLLVLIFVAGIAFLLLTELQRQAGSLTQQAKKVL